MKAKITNAKIALIGVLIVALSMTCFSTASAKINMEGDKAYCRLCHTEGPDKALKPEYQGPQGCVNCHSSSTSSATYEMTGGGKTVAVPVVNYTGSEARTTGSASSINMTFRAGLESNDNGGYHHVEGCTVCHDMLHGGEECQDGYGYLHFMACTINTPNSGPRDVKFISHGLPEEPPQNSCADGDLTYDGVCEVCHTETTFHLNTGDDAVHFDGENCTSTCHPHNGDREFSAPYAQSHATHSTAAKGPGVGCTDCHSDPLVFNPTLFADGEQLSTTTVCDACHSPDGAFNGTDGVVGAKTNWADGIYEADGKALKSGKEKWCATCHDDEPALSNPSVTTEAIVVDNPEADFVGDWPSYSGNPQIYGPDSQYHAAGDGTSTATWAPNILEAGEYSVYAWWHAHPNRATNAKYKIYYDGDSTAPPIPEVVVNQEENGGKWNWLWTGEFAAGGYVVLSNDANEYVIADAVKFQKGGQGTPSIYAPNVIGKDLNEDGNLDYGFFLTGHKINCLSCHDASKKHIDHEHRTYDADESTGQAINPYSDSYRLQGTNSMPSTALCLDCHNGDEVLGINQEDVSHTNLHGTNDIWPTPYGNGHNYHIDIWSRHFDSDWDGVTDSRESCIACHNVHGSPAMRMIRHGELISTYGTEDKVPALDFGYLVSTTGTVATATWPAPEGTYYVYAWWHDHSNRATNAPYTINHSGAAETIEVNQQINGGKWNLLGSGAYTFKSGHSVVLSNEDADGYVIADAIGFDSDGDGNPENIVDNDDASVTYSPAAWPSYSGNPQIFGADAQYYAKQEGSSMDRNATLQESVGGRIDITGAGVAQNGVCAACHAGISYMRDPYLGPKVIGAKADPKTVAPDGVTRVLLTAFVLDHNESAITVTVDLSDIDGGYAEIMYDDGINGGDATAGDNIYSLEITVPGDVDPGLKSLWVTATDPDGDGTCKIVLQVAIPGEIIMDNPEADFVGDWPSYSGNPQIYGPDSQYHAAGDGTSTATWAPNILEAGEYSVYAWWHAHPNRATNAKYKIYYDGDSTAPPIPEVVVNQEENGGKWNWLWTGEFAAGGYVVLNDDANEYVIADAIKLKLQP